MGMASNGFIHFHNSDDRFCGSTQPGRQFAVDDCKVTCPKCRPLIMAMVTIQGTACPETMLVNEEDTPEQRAEMEAFYCKDSDDCPVSGSWCDCSDNEVLQARWAEAEAA